VEPTAKRQVTRFAPDGRRTVEDHVVTEAPLEVRLGDTPIAVLMRTPGDEADLVRGFASPKGSSSIPQKSPQSSRFPALTRATAGGSNLPKGSQSTPNSSGATSTPPHPVAYAGKPRSMRCG
jgi:hypothetical protein